MKLIDETILKLKVTIIDVREAGFSPYGGINLLVRPIAGLKSLLMLKNNHKGGLYTVGYKGNT